MCDDLNKDHPHKRSKSGTEAASINDCVGEYSIKCSEDFLQRDIKLFEIPESFLNGSGSLKGT